MADKGICVYCENKQATQMHHVIHRSQCISLIKCEDNLVPLCINCHQELHHGKEGPKIDNNLKLKFQNKLELIFDKKYFTEDEIRQVLKISPKAVSRLCKTIVRKNGMIERRKIIRASMGGKIIIVEEEND